MFDEIASAAGASAEGESDRHRLFVYQRAIGSKHPLVVKDDAVALLDDVFPLAIDKLSHVALILDGVLPRNGVHRLAHRVLGEALGNRGMAARACLGADIAGGPR